MSLRGEPIETTATLPDGRTVQIRVGVPDDDGDARALARRLAEQLESGSIEPTAGAVERLVERPQEI